MASRKQEIRKEIKKKNAKLGIDVEAAKNIVDLQDQQGEDIHVEDFKNEEYNGEVIPFSTTPQKTKITGHEQRNTTRANNINRKTRSRSKRQNIPSQCRS